MGEGPFSDSPSMHLFYSQRRQKGRVWVACSQAAARFTVTSCGTLPWHPLAMDLLPGPQDPAQGFLQEVTMMRNADIAGQVPA